ncbi:MAG: 16S rRNA (cytosine(1402)-N(4))-methyltransferase RsmH [Candidatus Moraniibacteriota bacterium]
MFHTKHVPVLLQEVMAQLEFAPGMTVVDATLGGGSYTRSILEKVLPGGCVIAFDWDERALEGFREAAKGDTFLSRMLLEERLILIHASYADIKGELAKLGMTSVERVVADLGFSSDQMADPVRGLSFQTDGPLDMRLNSREKVTARDIVNEWSEQSLAELFRIYGDEREASRIARAIVAKRKTGFLTRTNELKRLIEENVATKRKLGRIHPATQVFQALRIAVNSERSHLERFLSEALTILRKGGRLGVVTFHSGEDALVKHFFQKEARGCICGMVPCECGRKISLTMLTKKPILPSDAEAKENPRSRSAKLRIVEKV